MLDQTVEIIHDNKNFTGTEKVTGVLSTITEARVSYRDKYDNELHIEMGLVQSVSMVDEDEHHEFVNEMLLNRKNEMIAKKARECKALFDEIVDFCPEDHASLLDQFTGAIEAMIESDQN